MIKVYNKLVRDKIPDILKNKNVHTVTRIIPQSDYEYMLRKKLQEEVSEYIKDGNIGELVDIYEVILTLAKHKGVGIDEFQLLKDRKASECGRFDKMISLIETGDINEIR